MDEGWAHPTMEDFRRQHLAQWPHDVSNRIVHETWEAYDRKATSLERYPLGALHRGVPPRCSPWEPPDRPGFVIRSFAQLFDYFVEVGYSELLDTGDEAAICPPQEFRQRVKDVGRHGR